MKELLRNPIVIQGALAFLISMLAFFVGLVLLKQMRRQATREEDEMRARISGESTGFGLAAYDGVIRKLKDQEKELERLRRQERERATESASLGEAVISNLGSGVVLFNPMNLVRQANPAARTLLGYASPSGLHARDLFRGVSEVRFTGDAPEKRSGADAPKAMAEAVEKSIRAGALFRRIEADYRTPSGQFRVLGITISPVRGAGGEALGAAGLVSDLTEITNMAQQMRLHESMAALGEMSAGIAHEFKNSLATISGYAQMLEQDRGSGSAKEFGGKIASETQSLARIVNDFLNFARPQSMVRQSLDLRPMIEDSARDAQVGLEISGTTGPLEILGDETALQQAFSNLMRNSAEAAVAGQAAKVTVRVEGDDKTLRLNLEDNGCGLSKEQLERIFIPFFTTKATGTGLGLALVHRIVTEHGGTIVAASEPGHGARFTLAFPRAETAKSGAETAEKPR